MRPSTRTPRTRGRSRRVLALSAAVSVLAFSGPTLPVAAQGTAEPPQLNPGIQPPHGALGPLGQYKQQQACMKSGSGAQIAERPWGQLTLGYQQAHDQGLTGAGQRIAVVDTGVNQHPQLAGRLDDGGTNVPKGSALTDCDGHGTIVAGIAAAQSTPGTGFVGVAPDSRILSLRQSSSLFQEDETGKTIGNTETMAQAIQHAVDQQVDVINVSQSSCQPMGQASNPGNPGNQMLHNAVKNAYDAGTVVVAAAGNADEACEQNNPGSPSTAVLPAWFDDYVLTVASVNQQGAPSEFTVAGPWVDVAAPGENLTALDPGQGGSGLATQISTGENGEMSPIQGTSFAAPYVSGLVALIKQKHPGMSAEAVMNRIKETSLHPGGSGGRNDLVGYGMVNPMAALNNVVPAEHNLPAAYSGPSPLGADVIPEKNWPAIIVAIGGALGGIGAVVFTAFLINAVRHVRARRAGLLNDD